MRRRSFLAAAATTVTAVPQRFAIAQPARERTLRFVPQANLTLLDPIFERIAITDKIQARAFETVPAIPLGQFQIRTAYRKDLTGLIEATEAFPWNIRRTG